MNRTLVEFPLIEGLDTKSDPKLVVPPRLLKCENGVFTQGGAVRKRNGYKKLSQQIVESPSVDPTTVYMFDDFDRADEAPIVGPPTGGAYEDASSGSWAVASGLLKSTSAATSIVLLSDAGHADAKWRLRIATMASTQDWGLIFRSDGDPTPGEFWLLQYDGTNLTLYKHTGGSFVSIVATAQAIAEGDTLEVRTSGADITVYVNDAHISALDTTDAFLQTSTYIGVYGGTGFSDERWSLLEALPL